jgi:tRNA threonylcarbamoyladenosine biosynthesis protein TsaE
VIDYQLDYSLEDIDAVVEQLMEQHLLDYNVITYIGDLGTGKTTLIKKLCKKLGVADNVTSPTYSIINEYVSDFGPLYHIDLYRLEDIEEAMDIGIEDYLYSGHLCMIEWPQLIEDLLPDNYIRIEIENLGKFTRRLRMIKI